MRYAKALLLYAQENNEEEAVYGETSKLAASFLKVPGLQKALLHPLLTDAQKAKLLLTAACGEAKPSKTLDRFVTLIVRKGRAEAMLYVAHSYGTLYREKHNVIQAKLVVPTKVDEGVVKKLRAFVEERSHCAIDFQVKEDAAIEGGFVLNYDTYQLDASVRTQLAKIRRSL